MRRENVLKSLHGLLLADVELAHTVGEELPEDAISPDFLPPEIALGNTAEYDFLETCTAWGKRSLTGSQTLVSRFPTELG